MKALCLLAGLSFFVLPLLSGQEVSSHSKKLTVYQHELYGPFFYHQVRKGETVYGISKIYGVTAGRILTINSLKETNISIDQRLRIPLNTSRLQWNEPGDASHASLYYTVRPRETMFRICRIYFNLKSKSLKQHNGLQGNKLSINQKLFIGYLPLQPSRLEESIHEKIVVEPLEQVQTDPVSVVKIEPDDSSSWQEEPTIIPPIPEDKEIIFQSGAAFWDKDQPDRGGLFVLHKEATIDSWIEIVNPMFNEKIIAKVVGNIPPDIYPKDVMIIVSPAIAKKLKAIDARFYVKVRYLRAKPILTNQ